MNTPLPMKSTSTSNWISITQNDEATNDKQENTIQLEPQALKTVEKVHKTTTGVTTVPKLHQVIRRRKVHKRKRVPTPIALPFGCLRSKVQVKAQECHDCTSPKNGFSFHSEGTSLSPIHNRLATVPSNLTALSHTRIKRRLGLVRRTHSPMTVVSIVVVQERFRQLSTLVCDVHRLLLAKIKRMSFLNKLNEK